MQINQQIVLVTGGARGLGAAITTTLVHAGAKVVVNYFKSHALAEQLQQQFPDQIFIYQTDVTDKIEVEQMFNAAKQHFGQAITSIINNALVDFKFNGEDRPKLTNLQWSEIQTQLDGAVHACLNTLQAGLPDMQAQHFGRIVNIGTNLVQNPVVPYHDYTAAKAALLAFTRTTAHELGEYGITVNMLSGGLLQTTDASHATPQVVFDLIASSTPLKKVVSPAEFADTVLFFLSPWSRVVTGQNLIVDGGLVKG
ncbi:3-oxoacyl-ACP reductase [Acinetobacter puyangensis]|uniref:3-oxoacyl-[acyl-carrier protein] reductase n=1 Tax=Acinetobacter puyangensis TaxID=1096779 RepID=A0A240EDP3_9GAMM|nr:3-oxoacyl-ACP reductase [Acinetobacter puyangensis]SNX46020.1 3-oxoacyl-[acyl-carrier protein] reductase [Acinetobacter puyangensis]